MDAEALYLQLGHLIGASRQIDPQYIESAEGMKWAGQVYALVRELGEFGDAELLKTQFKRARNPESFSDQTTSIMSILYRSLAIAELKAPLTSQGTFLNAGTPFDAMLSIGQILKTAVKQVWFVDPYMDVEVLVAFASQAEERVEIRLLGQETKTKPSFLPAVARWKTQYGETRPLQARTTAAALHDRLILVDSSQPYVVTQSFNGLAKNSPASIVRMDGDGALMKISAYTDIWDNGTELS